MLENYEVFEVFLIGCVGAIAPEILRFYKLRNSIRLTWSWSYIFISIAFVLLGGFITSLLQPSNNYAAFYSGVGTPFIINAIAKETQQSQDISFSDSQSNSLETENEITRVGKGISKGELTPQEHENLQKTSQNYRKMALKDFFRAL